MRGSNVYTDTKNVVAGFIISQVFRKAGLVTSTGFALEGVREIIAGDYTPESLQSCVIGVSAGLTAWLYGSAQFTYNAEGNRLTRLGDFKRLRPEKGLDISVDSS